MKVQEIIDCFFDKNNVETRSQNVIWTSQRLKILKDLLIYYESIDKKFYKTLSKEMLSFDNYYQLTKNSNQASSIWLWMPGTQKKNDVLQVNCATREFYAVAYMDWIKRFDIFEQKRKITIIKDEKDCLESGIDKNNYNKSIIKI